jgi:hypothetical protein
MTDTLVIVGCSDKKRAQRSAARDLYDRSQLFRAARRYAEREGTAGWLIVSARHGLLRPDREVDPYDARLPSGDDVRYWAFGAQATFAGWLMENEKYVEPGHGSTPSKIRGLRIVVLAGREYAAALERTAMEGLIETPLAGLGIGERLKWLAQANGPKPAPRPQQPTLFE